MTNFGVCLFWHPVRTLLYLDYFLNYGWELIYAFHSYRDYALKLALFFLVLFVCIDIALLVLLVSEEKLKLPFYSTSVTVLDVYKSHLKGGYVLLPPCYVLCEID